MEPNNVGRSRTGFGAGVEGEHGAINRGSLGEVQVKEPKKTKILPIRALKLGPTQFQAEVKRLQAEGRMPSLPELLDVIAEVRAEYRGGSVFVTRGRRRITPTNFHAGPD